MKNWIAMFAVCSAASGAFAEVVSLIPGQQVVVPASAPGSVPVTIEASLLKQTSQLSWLPAYECQNLTAAELRDPNGLAADDNFCVWGGISLLTHLERTVQGKFSANKPASLRSTYAQAFPYQMSPYLYLFRSDINGPWTGLKLELSTGVPTEVTTQIDYSVTNSKSPFWSTGGTYREKNMRLAATDKKVYSDVDGVSTTTQARPSVAYKQVSFPVWTFDSWVGPALPIAGLRFTSSEAERTRILTEAGFKVTSLGDGTLYAVGSYKTLNMRMTPEGQVLFSNSSGFLANARSSIRSVYAASGSDYNPMSFSANIGYYIN